MNAVLFAPGNAPYTEYQKSSTDRKYPLGTELILQDGRHFRYGKNGAVAAVAGKLYQGVVPGANWDTLSVLAAAVGDRAVTVTNGATTITADLFKGGYLVVEDSATTGAGRVYWIEGNDAEAAGSANFIIRLVEGIGEAWVAGTTTVTLIQHPMDSVIIQPSPPTAMAVGVPAVDIAASSFGWWQTEGIASVLTDGTVTIGRSVMASASIDGAVAAWALTEATPNTEIEPAIGYVVEVAPDTKYGSIHLHIT